MSKHLGKLLAAAALAWSCAAAAAGGHDHAGQPMSEKLSVVGAVENPLLLGVAELRALPVRQIGSPPARQPGPPAELKGVLLRDLLAKAVVVSKEHNDVKKLAIIAGATDGYKVVFSWNEIFNSPLGEGIVVFFERDGRPLDDGEGRIALVSAGDLRTGPRHVRWLSQIEVRRIVD